jgi:hypothetical protein
VACAEQSGHFDIAEREDIPILQHALGRNRREVECWLRPKDRIGLSAGFKLFEIAVHHRSRAAGKLHEMGQGASVIDMGVGDQQ